MPGEESQTATGSSDEKGNNIWSLLPSFDPTIACHIGKQGLGDVQCDFCFLG